MKSFSRLLFAIIILGHGGSVLAADRLFNAFVATALPVDGGQDSSLVVDVQLDLNVASTLTTDQQVEIPMPDGQLLIGTVEATTSGLSGDAVNVISLQAGKGSLELKTSNSGESELLLIDTAADGYYHAVIDSQGAGRLVEENPDEYACIKYPLPAISSIEPVAAELAALAPDLDTLQGLQSKPGATNVIYIDYWGGALSGTIWNANYTSGDPINYTAYNRDGDASTFSAEERYLMWLGWQEVVEDYSSFDVNVTTNPAVYFAAPLTNRIRNISTTTNDFLPGYGGVAYLHTFGRNDDYAAVSWTWNSSASSHGMTISHEIGHQMGLNHDGTSLDAYYRGSNNWGPVMGAPFGSSYVQWSQGEYPDANNTLENDIAIIAAKLGSLSDDVGDNIIDATEIGTQLTVVDGLITPAGHGALDVDYYRFTLAATAEVLLEITPFIIDVDDDANELYGTNLSMQALLLNAAETPIAEVNHTSLPANNRLVYQGTLGPGTYYLKVQGAPTDPNWVTGFGDYGNGGKYRISLNSISTPNGDTTTLPPADDDNSTANLNGLLAVSKWEHAFMRFDTSGISGTVNTATLRVYHDGRLTPLTLYVGEADDNWSTASGTPLRTFIHNNPALQLATANVTTAGYIEIDLTSYVSDQVNGDDIVSLELSTDQNTWSNLSSMEGLFPPELVISTDGGNSNQPPTAVFTASPENGQAPLDVSLDANESDDPDGNIVSYAWDLGDGNSATGSTAFHTYNQAGDYTVTLTVRDDGGLTASSNTVIHVTSTPGGTTTLPPTDDANSTANLNGLLVVSKWEHAFMRFDTSGISGTVNTATLRVYHDGRLTPLTLFVGEADDNWSTATGTPARTFIHNNPALQLATANVTTAGYVEIDLTSYVSDQVNGDDIVSLELSTDQNTWSNLSSMEGLFPPELVISTNGGSSNQPPTAVFTASPENGQVPLDVSLDANESDDPDGNIVSYAWDLGDGNSATGSTVFHTYNQAGEYTVTLTVTDDGGLTASSNTVIHVTSTPGGTTTLPPTDDANSTANLNGLLAVSKWEHAFMRFDTSGISGTVNTATLRVYHDGRLTPLTLYVGEADDNWSTASGTPLRTFIHNNPALQLATANVTTAGYIEIDLTSYVSDQVNGDDIVSLELSTDQNTWSNLSSMEGAFQPELVIDTSVSSANPISRISVSSDNLEGNSGSFVSAHGEISNGRYVVFGSGANNLVTNDYNNKTDGFIHDLVTGETVRIDHTFNGAEPDNYSYQPLISSNGQFVVFVSAASNFVSDDTNNMDDIFVLNRTTASIEKVDISSVGIQNYDTIHLTDFKANGRFILFQFQSNETEDLFLHDRVTNETRNLCVNAQGQAGNGSFCSQGAMSEDGRFITFSSNSSNLVTNDMNGITDVFIYDRINNETSLISISSDGTQGQGYSSGEDISADGRFVVFTSSSHDLVGVNNNFINNIFVRDRLAGTTQKVTEVSGGGGGYADGASTSPTISADGRYISFTSWASNLVENDTNQQSDIFVHDQLSGKTIRIEDTALNPIMAPDGSHVIFDSFNPDLVPYDYNGAFDVFLAPVNFD